MKIAITSGYYNPLHSGHVDYLEAAKELADIHVAIINNDMQVKIKGSVPFMDQWERMVIVGALRCVNLAYLSVDKDGSQCQSLRSLAEQFRYKYPDCEIMFCNGGDRGRDNIPEDGVCEELGIHLRFGVGGTEKKNSSSKIIANAHPIGAIIN